MAKLEDILKNMADMGPGLNAAFGATSDVLELIREKSKDGKSTEILTGDVVADTAIIRALGVEETIKNKWNVDLCDVLDVLQFLTSAFSLTSDFYKG